MNNPPSDGRTPQYGAEHALDWPMPVQPGHTAVSFYGTGDSTTDPFELKGDGSLRAVTEAGPLELEVRRRDGSLMGQKLTLPEDGGGLMAIPEGGTYTLVIRAPARWAVTVVSRDPAAPG